MDSKGMEKKAPPAGSAALIATIVILLACAIVRLLASLGDLWFDEIWTFRLLEEVSSLGEVVTRARESNNHILNTCFLYLLGHQSHLVVYRLPSLILGIGSILLAGMVGARRGRAEAFIAMVLVGTSYVMIHYSSEARGYGPAVFFALLSFHLVESHLDKADWKYPVLFSLGNILGLLSMLIYLHFYGAVLIWSAFRIHARRRERRHTVRILLRWHALPVLFLIFLYFNFIKDMSVGWAPDYVLFDVLRDTLSLAAGGPEGGTLAYACAAAALVLLAISLAAVWNRESRPRLVLLLLVIASPAALMILMRPKALFVRYFIIAIAFFLVLYASFLAKLWARKGIARVACLILVTAFIGLNAWPTLELIRKGRGHYVEALEYMAERTAGPNVNITGIQDFCNHTIIRFYTPYLKTGKRMVYRSLYNPPPGGHEWFIHFEFHEMKEVPASIKDDSNEYELKEGFPSVALSGFEWYIYHNRDMPLAGEHTRSGEGD